jgi:hypothetical protein
MAHTVGRHICMFRDALVKQWDIGTMTCLRTLQGHKGPVQSVKVRAIFWQLTMPPVFLVIPPAPVGPPTILSPRQSLN